jgi:hypothetical protein
MADEIDIPDARPHSDSHPEPDLSERFPSIPKAEIDAIRMEARRGADLFGLTREEEQQFAERFATAILRQRSPEDPRPTTQAGNDEPGGVHPEPTTVP